MPGEYRDWRSSKDAEVAAAATYEYTVVSFDAVHKWTESGKPPSAAFEIQDLVQAVWYQSKFKGGATYPSDESSAESSDSMSDSESDD